jgi:hypothetical protein
LTNLELGKRNKMPRKQSAIAANDDRLKLIEALKFAAIAGKDDNEKNQFVSISDNWLSAENDTFSLGINVDVDLELCPHSEMFKAALQQCGQQFQLTQLDHAVSLKSGNFRAAVPAIDRALLSPFAPDLAVATINDKLREGFAACLRVIPRKDDTRIYTKGAMLTANTISATNGGIAVEFWHGIDLPGPLLIPRKTIETIVKLGKPLAQLGFSDSSVTFYFDDLSFIKTRLLVGDFPNMQHLFTHNQFISIWKGFYDGLSAINAFVVDDVIHFHSGHIASHSSLELGASYKVDYLPPGYVFSAAYWRAIEPLARQIALAPVGQPFGFMGYNVRGLIIGRTA